MSSEERKSLYEVRKQLAEEEKRLAEIQKTLEEEFIPNLEKAKEQLAEEQAKLNQESDSNKKAILRESVSRIENYIAEFEKIIKELRKATVRIERLIKKAKDYIE